MTPAEVEETIAIASRLRVSTLYLSNRNLHTLPESISDLTDLTELHLENNQLTNLPESIGKLTNLSCIFLQFNQLTSLPDSIGNFTNLVSLDLCNNKLTNLPEAIGNLSSLTRLFLNQNQLISLPDSICKLTKLTSLDLSYNQLTNLPEDIGNLSGLTSPLYLNQNQLTSLPNSIGSLLNLTTLWLNDNPWVDLSNLQNIPNLKRVYCFGTNLPRRYWNKLSEWKAQCLLDEDNDEIRSLLIEHVGYEKIGAELNALTLYNLREYSLIIIDGIIETIADLSILRELPKLKIVQFMGADLPRRYWTKLSEWKPEWLLNEDNAEIRRILIEQLGYEKICEELNAVTLNTWREYTLLKIDRIAYGWPMVLLKMICPSTAHIHILRVPPQMESAEEAITWINHGIHPDEFAVQT